MTYNTDIERLNYYEGEFLGAVDFQAEQEYHRDMRRRHNIGQHTWGIVTGLDLVQAPNGNTNSNGTEVDVYLQPGMAVDGFGREIVVLSQLQLTADMFAAFYSSGSPSLLYLWIGYQQALLQPPSDACTSMNVTNAFGRVQETYTVNVTATGTPQPNSDVLVDGTAVNLPTVPAPPSSSSSSSSSSSNAAPADPPSITLPYDNSVPYQEFSTDDTNLIWWLPLGRVKWDPANEVFLQIDPASAAKCREYAGSVSAWLYAPAGLYTIVDRDAPYPLPMSATDPNYWGAQVEVAGSLQVDRAVLIGGVYDSTKPPQSPLTITASLNSADQQLIEFCNPAGTETWYINQEFDGSTLGLNIGEFTAAGNSVDNRIFIQPTQTSSTAPSPLNVGIGTSTPRNPLAIRAQGSWEELLSFENTTGTTNWHLNQSPQGSGYQRGLNFCETQVKGNFRLFLQEGGNVGIGTALPQQNLSVNAGLNIDQADQNTGTALNPGLSFGSNSGEGIASARSGPNKYGLNFYTGSALQMSIASVANGGGVTTAGNLMVNGNAGVGTAAPLQNLSVNGGLNIDQANINPGGVIGSGSNNVLTFGTKVGGTAGSGEGIGSCRVAGGLNLYGLDFYTQYVPRMSINNAGAVTVGSLPATPPSPAPGGGSLSINGNRTYLMGVDGAGNHWIMAGGTAEPRFNALGFNPVGQEVIIGSATAQWDVTVYGKVNGTKVGYVADRFINRDGARLERGDVVVLHSTPSSHYYGPGACVPIAEVQLANTALNTRVCGIVDEPALPDSKIRDLDRQKLGNVQVGLMVTLGAYAYCKVDADIAAISPGDLLTTSPTPGYAQKLDPQAPVHPGAVIGKALGSLASGKGTIPLLVSHQ